MATPPSNGAYLSMRGSRFPEEFTNLHLDASATGSAVASGDPDILLGTGLRPTRQRIALLKLLIATNRRYVTAEILYDEASKARCHISRATVCSALRQFEQVGLAKRNQRTKITESLVCPRPKL